MDTVTAPFAHHDTVQRPDIDWTARFTGIAAGILYLVAFQAVYKDYISYDWAYAGFTYRDLPFGERASIYLSVILVSGFLPDRIDRPSYVVIWLLYAIVFVPTQAITYMVGKMDPVQYQAPLLAFTAGMCLICHVLQKDRARVLEDDGLPGDTFFQVTLALFAMSSLFVVYYYWSILTFAGIDDVYVQRFAAGDITSGPIGYLRTYHAFLLTPLMLALAMSMKSKRIFVPLGVAGFLLSYMIDASKTSLVAPLAMIGFGMALRWRSLRLYHMTFMIGLLSIVSWLFVGSTRGVRFLADILLLRTISIPGQTFSQYLDVFQQKGFTWWSNVTGISAIVPPPAAFRADPFWPMLGQIVGADFFGVESRVNVNANPFVGEGVAAAGWLGVLVISVLMALFLRSLDRLTVGWDRRFVLMLVVPIGLALTNVHLSTFLVSFGGVAWLLIFRFCQPVYHRTLLSTRVGGPAEHPVL